jgi:hypothetical protein
MPSLTSILVAWGVLAPLAMYGWLAVELGEAERDKGKAVREATLKTVADQTNVCNGRVATIESKINADALETAKAAREAGEREAELRLQLAAVEGKNVDLTKATTATAENLAKVQAVVLELCRSRASCRDRASLLKAQ